MLTEADTCREYVLPGLQAAGWTTEPHSLAEQRTFTDGRIVVAGGRVKRGPPKRADYILRYRRDFAIAVVEAKPVDAEAGAGMQQAKDYAQILGLEFAYATNGKDIIEFDFLTGFEQHITAYPTPAELWARLHAQVPLAEKAAEQLLTASRLQQGQEPRYYQEICINRAVEAFVRGQRRALLTCATGTGKTVIAFQVCWKLWNARWNKDGAHRRPRMLFLADRNFLVDDPKDKTFAPFGDARHKIQGGIANKSREMYFATYQSIAEDEARPGLYREYQPDFFDLIVVDECHRGSATEGGNWRQILEYFQPAYQLGMTATPLRQDNRDTYLYFGNPLYTYSLRQGIEDGFLAPYRVHRVVTAPDAVGWRPRAGQVDTQGNRIPDEEYNTKDFERRLVLKPRTEAVARHLTDFLTRHGRFDKTIVFCVDQEHADTMRRELANLNADLVRRYPDYVCRVTADEGDIGRGHLSRFQDVETESPTILTTSQLLTTGMDAPTCKNVVLFRVVGSMTEFKQIIGRGTRVRDDCGKFYFSILDYTGSATRHFADPDFDGEPAFATQEEIDEYGNRTRLEVETPEDEEGPGDEDGGEVVDDGSSDENGDGQDVTGLPPDMPPAVPRKYYVDGGTVAIVAHMVYDLDTNGTQLRVRSYTDYTQEAVRTLFASPDELRAGWTNEEKRREIVAELEKRGIVFDELAEVARQPDADPFDLLCHVAFNAPLRTRRERAAAMRSKRKDFFESFGPTARAILDDLVDKYAEHGLTQFSLPDVLQVPPLTDYGNVVEIAAEFGGAGELREAVGALQAMLYEEDSFE